MSAHLPSIVPKPRNTGPRKTGPHAASFLVRPRPVLLKAEVRRQRASSLFALWHLLSLDAPTVAAMWTWFIGRSCGVRLPWTSLAAMFLAVWMLYAADRLLDARAPHDGEALEERHRFHHRYRTGFLAALVVSSALLATLLPRLIPSELRLFAALGSLLFGYFFLIHLRPSASHAAAMGKTARLPKELAVGVFFPAAVFIPTVARVPVLRLELLPSAFLLAAACTLNCLYVYKWEHPGRARQAHWTTRVATQHLIALCVATMVSCVATAIAYGSSVHHAGETLALPVVACAGSIALFLLLDALRSRLQPVILRTLVDAALLTPLAFAPLLLR